jgi:flagella basal body P-ring formation protein FlgA
MNLLSVVVYSLLLTLPNSTLFAAEKEQDHGVIYKAIQNLAGQQVEIQEVDSRLRLKECEGDLQVRYPFSKNTTVEVLCPVPGGWKIYLTLRNTASQVTATDTTVKNTHIATQSNDHQYQQTNAVVAKSILLRGVPIKASDLELQAFPIYQVRTANFSNPEEIIGFEPTQTIPAGTLIALNMLNPPYLVKKGDTVTLIYQKGGILVSNVAVALESGELEKTIEVRVPSTGKVVSAIVSQSGEVRIP